MSGSSFRWLSGMGAALIAIVAGATQAATESSLTADDCVASLVQFGNPVPVMPSALRGLEHVPWVAGRPASSRLYAYLFYYHPDPNLSDQRAILYAKGVTPEGGSTKILWVFLRRTHSRGLIIRGSERITGATFVQHIRGGDGFVPSIVVVPSPGCWDIKVTTTRPPRRRVAATFTFIVPSG